MSVPSLNFVEASVPCVVCTSKQPVNYQTCSQCGTQASASATLSPREKQSLQLSPDDLPQPILVQLYDVLKVHAVERRLRVWYLADERLLTSLAVDLSLVSRWKDARLAYEAEDVIVPGHSEVGRVWLVSRVGLLKLLGVSDTASGIRILEHIAGGLEQFSRVERSVKSAEDRRLEYAKEERRQEEARVQKEFEEWELEAERKRLARKKRREERRQREKKAFSEENMDAEKKDEEKKSDEGEGTLLDKYQKAKLRMTDEGNLRSSNVDMMTMLRNTRQKNEAALIAEEEKIRGVHAPEGENLDEEEEESSKMVTEDERIKSDPTRVRKDVPVPTAHVLTEEELFREDGTPRISLLRAHFAKEGRLSHEACKRILKDAREILKKEENCIELVAPLTIFGDVHGQFFDLCELFKKAGSPAQHQQLWLGDYVDRGAFGCEVVLILLAAKIKYPKHVWLLRGNHESRQMTQTHNFQAEAVKKFSEEIYEHFMYTFDHLPLTAVVSTTTMGRFYCAHGGLSPMIRNFKDVNRLERFEEPPGWGPMCDVLWSDPADESEVGTGSARAEWLEMGYEDNVNRGCGVVYGKEATQTFLEDNEMVCLIRAHEVKKHGYQEHRFFDEDRPLPMVITLFSAPNYCGNYENRAACMFLHDKIDFYQIAWTTPPYALADGTNVFSMTMPMIAESITGFFLSILEELAADDDEEEEKQLQDALDAEAAQRLRSKVLTMGRAMAALRAGNKNIKKKITNNVEEIGEVRSSDEAFEKSKESDKRNEMHPALRTRRESMGNLLALKDFTT